MARTIPIGIFKTKKAAEEYVGGHSDTSKMPGISTGIPAGEQDGKAFCKTGAMLQKKPGSVCEDCYACKGMYQFQNVKDAQRRRFERLDAPGWEDAWCVILQGREVMRWHDSGDLQSLAHLERIVRIAERTPSTRHWLPTKERHYVEAFLRKHGAFPENLVVRISAHMRGEVPEVPEGVCGSAVDAPEGADVFRCKAPEQDGACRDCRACWDASVRIVSYKRH